jgi:hypothetical protein
MEHRPKPPKPIYMPQLCEMKCIPAQSLTARQHGADCELSILSAQNGKYYMLTLRAPMSIDDKPRTMDEAEIRQRFSAECVQLNIFLEEKRVEFWGQNGFLSGLRCASCELTMPD